MQKTTNITRYIVTRMTTRIVRLFVLI